KQPPSDMSDVKEQQEEEEEKDLRSVLVTSVLTLEKIDQGLYRRRGSHPWVPRSNTLFGGQIVGQALVAAGLTVGKGLHAHSLHCYFVRPG
uniref:Acyl-CoA thioesterase-like N-terminal HotDog domain-containing protein n=1 Tax=Petromyzon marinus TaxID=7757 RepID=S4RZ44_PETMA